MEPITERDRVVPMRTPDGVAWRVIRRRRQCKDIPDVPILRFLASHGTPSDARQEWTNWFSLQGDAEWDRYSVRLAMPAWVTGSLALAKMRQMMQRGVVDGCNCGCRGDFVLTARGHDELLKRDPEYAAQWARRVR